MSKQAKLAILVAGILACVGFLAVVSINSGGGLVYYYTVGEFKKLSKPVEGNVRINGKVAEGSIERSGSGLDLRFAVSDGSTSLPVVFHGVVPDTFTDGADVVIEGNLLADGTFRAKSLLAKCPSKYQAKVKNGEKIPHQDGRSKGI